MRHNYQSKKRLFIIIGTTRGIGRAFFECASLFSGNEFVLVNRRSVPQRATRVTVRQLRLDLSKKLTHAKLESIFYLGDYGQYSHISLLCIASVVTPIASVGMIHPADIEKSCYTNFLNYALIVNEFIRRSSSFPQVKKRIVIISSGAALSAYAGLSLYCSTKAAIEMFTRSVFEEQRKQKKIEILAIDPGIVDTRMQKTLRDSAPRNFPKAVLYRRLYTKGKLKSPEEIAQRLYALLVSNGTWMEPVIKL